MVPTTARGRLILVVLVIGTAFVALQLYHTVRDAHHFALQLGRLYSYSHDPKVPYFSKNYVCNVHSRRSELHGDTPNRTALGNDAVFYITGSVKMKAPVSAAVAERTAKVVRNIRTIATLARETTVVICANPTGKHAFSAASGGAGDAVNFTFVPEPESLHALVRTQKLAAIRNALHEHVVALARARNQRWENVFMIVMDLDDVYAAPIDATVLLHAFALRDRWDALSFNRPGYYDVWALRYARFDFNVFDMAEDRWALVSLVRKDIERQLNASTQPLYPVRSAFNGLAIYRLNTTAGCSYRGEDAVDGADGAGAGSPGRPPNASLRGAVDDCEHVAFHRCMAARHGARIMIYKYCLVHDVYFHDAHAS